MIHNKKYHFENWMVLSEARGAHYKHSFTTFACSCSNSNSFRNLLHDDAK